LFAVRRFVMLAIMSGAVTIVKQRWRKCQQANVSVET
jgi:hypothetical protein